MVCPPSTVRQRNAINLMKLPALYRGLSEELQHLLQGMMTDNNNGQ